MRSAVVKPEVIEPEALVAASSIVTNVDTVEKDEVCLLLFALFLFGMYSIIDV